ncbi:MAG: non-ribosomal peptide synthetase, partial [bacterium]|nr:non-ribosomal peptide synthetase [bacterium]
WLPDGNIEFLGRIDQQVKIWGFRIEPGEIENRLLEHENIIQTVVFPRHATTGNSGNTPGDEKKGQFLCAYFVSKTKIPAEEPRNFLLKHLPDYMIPGFFVQVEKIPLTQNGKINRKALPEPAIREADEILIPPRDDVEEGVAGIWSEVLGLKREFISIDKNFFEYGGYSIKATQVINKIHKAMNARIPLADMFEKPTIRGLSQIVKKTKKERFIALKPVEKRDYYPVSSAQKRLYLIQQMETDNLSYNVLKVVVLEGNVDIPRLEHTFRNLLKRHDTLRTSFHFIAGELVQGIQPDIDFEIQYYHLKNAQPGKAGAEGIIEKFVGPFDLSQPPLMRVGLIDSEENPPILMVDMHHIISDATSNDVLTAEFINTYAGKELPPLRVQYKDYAGWQNSGPQKEAVKKQEEYWLKAFARKVPVLTLAADYPRPRVRSFEGNTITFTFDRQEEQELKTLA